MNALTDEAVTAAAAAIFDQSAIPVSSRGDLAQWSNRLAVAALEAAAPHIRQAERDRIRAGWQECRAVMADLLDGAS